jgi:hypothetical protein
MADTEVQDPIDALDLSDVVSQVDDTEPSVPDELVLGSQRSAAPDVEPGEEEETEEEAAQRARDEKGRFAKKDGKEGKEGEQLADQQQQQPADKTGAQRQPPATDTTPFQYRAMGANHALDGASVDKDGNLLVKAEQVGTIRQALNALHMAEQGTIPIIQERDQRIGELGGQVEDLRVLGQTAEALISLIEKIVKDPSDETAVNEFWKLRQGGWDIHMARAENQYLASKLQRASNGTNGRGAPDRANGNGREQPAADAGMPDVETAQATTTEYLEQAKLDNRFRALTADDWKQLETRLQRTPYAFLRKATAEEARQFGPIVFDIPAFVQEVTDYHTSLTRQRDTATKRTKLAVDNARKTQKTIDAPPVPGGGRQPAVAGKKQGFQNEKEVDNWLESDEL